MCKSTNIIESLHAIRRKFISKRLNFSKEYQTRANLAILSKYIINYEELILGKMKISSDWIHLKWFDIHSGLQHKFLNQKLKKTTKYMASRQKWKYKKYSEGGNQKKEMEYASTLKEKIENLENENKNISNNNNVLQCCHCRKQYKSLSWKDKHEKKCNKKMSTKKELLIDLPESYVSIPAITCHYLQPNHKMAILEDTLSDLEKDENTDEHAEDEDVSDFEELEDEDVSDFETISEDAVINTDNTEENENDFIDNMKPKHKKKFFMLSK